jgi:hypothetical protein
MRICPTWRWLYDAVVVVVIRGGAALNGIPVVPERGYPAPDII